MEPHVFRSQSARHLQPDGDNLSFLQGHLVFGTLESLQIKRLASFARMRKVAAGTTIFAKGDSGTALFVVIDGTLKMVVPSNDGREAMFDLHHAGEIFGEIALLDGRPRTADAVAISDCELMVIERRDFFAFVNAKPAVASKLIELLCARLRVLSEHFEEVVFLNLPQRLARLLLRLAEEKRKDQTKLKITQLELSQMLGSTRESVNKQLRTWAKANIIGLERGGIALLTPARLVAVATDKDAESAATTYG